MPFKLRFELCADANIVQAVKKCYKRKFDSGGFKRRFYRFLKSQKHSYSPLVVSVSAMQPCPYFFISLPLLRE